MEPGTTYFNENDGHLVNCTRTATGLGMTFTNGFSFLFCNASKHSFIVPVCYDGFGKQHQVGDEWTDESSFVLPPMIGTRFNCSSAGNNLFSAEAIGRESFSELQKYLPCLQPVWRAQKKNHTS